MDSKYRLYGYVPDSFDNSRYKENNDYRITSPSSEYRDTFPVTPSRMQSGSSYRMPSLYTPERKFYGPLHITNPSHTEFYETQRRLSSSSLTDHQPITTSIATTTPAIHDEIQTSQNGRFRPPPFFDTVLVLRKRLYYLGGKAYPTDEPPCDRNVHKLWRSAEKHKVNYVSCGSYHNVKIFNVCQSYYWL